MSNPERGLYENPLGNKPCIMCNASIHCAALASYATINQQSLQSQYCGRDNMELWIPSASGALCSPCTPLSSLTQYTKDTLVFSQLRPLQTPTSNDECMARCGANFSHTKLLSLSTSLYTAVPTDNTFHPQKLLQCEACDNNTEVCLPTGVCIPGLFLLSDNRTCQPCNATPCTQVGYYRTRCVDGVHDSICAPCDPSRLRNPPSCSNQLCPYNTQTTRRFVASSLMTDANGQCPVTCINNHMWIDNATGTVGPLNSERSVCLPCSSDYAKANVPAWGEYSVQGGVCQKCDLGRETVMEDDTMCRVKPGWSNNSKTQTYTTVQVVAPTTAAFKAKAKTTTSRRLLQVVVAERQVVEVPAYRQVAPALETGSRNAYYECCKEILTVDDSDAFRRCTQQTDSCYVALRKQKPPTQTCCTNTTTIKYGGRRLLQTQEPNATYQCPAGSFKDKAGEGACTFCADGGSTFWHETNTSQGCMCFPGYHQVSSSCVQCDPNSCRDSRRSQELPCAVCREGWHAVGYGATQCHVKDGFHLLDNANDTAGCEVSFPPPSPLLFETPLKRFLCGRVTMLP